MPPRYHVLREGRHLHVREVTGYSRKEVVSPSHRGLGGAREGVAWHRRGGTKGFCDRMGWWWCLPPAETPETTHFEEGLALLADVSHCEAGAGIAHDVGVFGQKAVPDQPPEGRAWLWQGRGGTGPQGAVGTQAYQMVG